MYDFKLSSFVLIMAAESLSASVVIAMVEQAKNTRCFFLFVYHLPWQQHHHWHINHEYLRSIIASLHQKPYINGPSLFDVA